MASGSYFTLYRKYTTKASESVVSFLKNQYLEEYKKSCLSKKTVEEHLKDLPKVLDFAYGKKETEYDESTKTWKDVRDYSIDGRRLKYQSLLLSDNSYVDELLTWHFCSSFTCLKEEWNLDSYVGSRSQYELSKLEAEKILQACDYLLSGNWSDDFEKILNNRWINILSEGNNSDSYWKYVYRNDKKSLKEIPRDEQESAEYDIKRLRHVLDTFTSADEDLDDKLILIYTAW